jgi:PAS domain S-box-containing protein
MFEISNPQTRAKISAALGFGFVIFDGALKIIEKGTMPLFLTPLTVGQSLEEVIPGPLKESIIPACQRSLAGEDISLGAVRWEGGAFEVSVIAASSENTSILLAKNITGLLVAEDELQRKNELLIAIVDDSTTLLYSYVSKVDGSKQFLYISANVKRFHGVTAEEVYANSELIDRQRLPDDYEDYRRKLDHCIKNMLPFFWEGPFETPTGRRWLRLRSKPSLQQNGDIIWNGTATDITDLKAAELALRNSEERYRFFVENSPDSMFFQDLTESGELVYSWYSNSMGMRSDQIIGTTDSSIFTEVQDLSLITEIKQRVMTTHKAERHLLNLTFLGRRIYLDVLYLPRLDKANNLIGLAGYARDVTSQEQQREMLKTLYGTSTLLGASLDTSDVLDQIMVALPKILSHESALLVIKEDDQLYIPRYRVDGEMGEAQVRQGIPIDMMPVFKDIEQEMRPIQLTLGSSDFFALPQDGEGALQSLLVAPLIRQNHVIGAFYVYRKQWQGFTNEDQYFLSMFANQAALAIENARLHQRVRENATVSERERIARELHDSVSQTLFSANMLAQAIPMIYNIDQQEALAQIEALGVITNGALSEVRLLLVELKADAIVKANLQELLDHLLKSVAAQSGCTTTLQMPHNISLPAEVQFVTYRIAQEALMNIRKHASPKNVNISLVYSPGNLNMTVADDGKGFNVDQVKGSHFGIRIMRDRAETIGGELKVESAPDKGTIVTFSWKVYAMEDEND